MALAPNSIFKPEVLTGLVELRAQEEVVYDLQDFAPIRRVNKRRVKLNLRVGSPGQIGQFRADNGLTPIVVPELGFQELEIEMPMLSEKEVIQEDLLVLLNSPDDRIARDVANTIIDNGVRLRNRNINLTRLMPWLAVQDALTITYPSGATLQIGYLMNNSDGRMSGTHLVTTAVSWANPAADIIGDVRAWSQRIADDYGQRATELRVSTTVWNHMQANTAIQQRVGTVTDPRTPDDPDQVARVLGLRRIVIYDELYKDAAGVTQRYLPVNKVVLTADPGGTGGRERILEVLDGPVARFNDQTRRIEVANNPGALADIWAAPDPPQEHVRVTTARVPKLIREAIMTATVIL